MQWTVHSEQWTVKRPGTADCSLCTVHCSLLLRFDVHKDGQLGHVVEDDEDKEGHQHHKGGLVDALLYLDADIAADHNLNEQQNNQTAIENRKGHQVEDAEIEADLSGEPELRQPTVHLRCVPGHAGNARMAGDAAEMDGWLPKFGLAGQISLNLGILNLMPFPILDGGLIVLLLIEIVIRRDISIQVKERIYQAAFVVLVAFFAFIIFNDVTKLPIFMHVKP